MVRPIEIEAMHNDGLSFVQIARNLQLMRWMNGAAIALLIYDTCLILGDEVEFLWPKRWSVIKAFYFLNRALCATFTMMSAQQFISMNSMSDGFCTFNLIGVGIATFISFAMCNWMLLARTRALVGCERPILDAALVAYFFLSYTITGVLVILTSLQFRTKIFFSPTIRICSASIHPKEMGLIWIWPMLFETTIFVITTVKLYQTRKHGACLGSRLFSVLFRDGVCYYVSICLFRTWNLVAWNLRPISFTFTGIFILWVIMSVACSRLQLNLLKAIDPLYESDVGGMTGETSSAIPTHGTTTFGRRMDGNRCGRRRRPSSTFDDLHERRSYLDRLFHIPITSLRSFGESSRVTMQGKGIELHDQSKRLEKSGKEHDGTQKDEHIQLRSMSSPNPLSPYRRTSGEFPDDEARTLNSVT
ncbi:SubName: Full=Uncharacterized protein {ECO:0000313/EMBL:CCA75995.1} [Serendipita indica DSM 11827]|uniref:DUF6533 domain-containing protein n=1 Tax=Serendipita indica (strain DSM 11827) TaxID=1109443 RepID=G4TXF2_SERID|nr:SubName: Full=Uncharacterized protein {ECO:0000313/EMBL:CCA75995.1} [Serendipita indica DSM 11827]CCA75995.1 hypothetical protein PIIN_09995 [Serendipita indica DSM 11827]